MKGSNSRFSLRPKRRYSNTAHIQGGMVTDADLTEAGQLHQARDEAQNAVAMPSGAPGENGVVQFNADGSVSLRQGWVLAEGKQGQLVSASGAASVSGAALFAAQADLPDGPDLPDGKALLYADLWERPVFALQDDYLADAGLHGAETSYRTRTMVQIKALPLGGDMNLEQAMSDLADGIGVFARKGSARASVTPKNTEIAVDDCDPCADQVDIVPSVPNALFRVEVVEVTRDAQGRPSGARFAWSMENAAMIETMARLKDPATGDAMKAAFSRDGAVYQYFSDVTEAQIGRFAPGFDPVAPEFAETLTDKPFTHVRRWDGAALVNLKASTVPASDEMGQGKMTAAANEATLTVDAFTVLIDFDGAELLAGDHWLIELRRFAPEAGRVRLIGATDNKNAAPIGVEHHFCTLFLSDDSTGQVLSDADKRRLSFPALTDIPATHVSFDPDCPAFFDDAENVADALNALCDLDASQVAFDPPDDCARFAGTSTVDEALKRLCVVQDDTMLTRVLRTMMDWGVVCGIRLKLEKPGSTAITWTAGTILDRTGRLIDVKAGAIDLRDVPDENYLGKLPEIVQKAGEICLSMGADKEGTFGFYFSDRATAFGPIDRSFDEAVRACIEGRKWIDFGKITRPLDKAETGIVKKMADVWANRRALDGKVPLSASEAAVAKAVNKTLAAEYVEKAAPARGEQIERMLKHAEEEINPGAVRGPARDIRHMQLESAKFGIIAVAEEEDALDCECLHAFPPCPPAPGKFGHLVPVACFRMIEASEKVSGLSDLCDSCCRKQAITWRASRYYEGSVIDARMNAIKKQCCRPTDRKPGVDWNDWLDDWSGSVYEPKPFDPRPKPGPRPEPHPFWPPRKRPDYGSIIPIDPGWTDPVFTDRGKYINPKPDIRRLPPAEAATVLTGNGFDVVETLDLDDAADPMVRLAELGLKGEAVLGRDAPEPGDKVVMLSSGGKAVDFVVLEKGSGKLPFETEAATAARVEKIVATLDLKKTRGATLGTSTTGAATLNVDLAALETRLEGLMAERDKAAVELSTLNEIRDKLSADVGGLTSTLTEAASLREKLASDVEKSRAELKEITTLKEASLKDISSASEELAEVRKAHGEFVVTMRREQPIESLLGRNTAAIEALKSRGLVSVGDLEKANTRTLTTVLANAGITGSEAKTLAADFVKRR